MGDDEKFLFQNNKLQFEICIISKGWVKIAVISSFEVMNLHTQDK
jgi:hypothetical protein